MEQYSSGSALLSCVVAGMTQTANSRTFYRRLGLSYVRLLFAIALIYPALEMRSPTFLKLRPWIEFGVAILGVIIVLASLQILRQKLPQFSTGKRLLLRSLAGLGAIVATVSLVFACNTEIQFHLVKYRVLHANTDQLAYLGQHLMVGYRDGEMAQTLVQKQAVGGLFLSTRNIQNRTPDQIRAEIKGFQDIRWEQGLSPLWIATDQEGGIVSRLSPPLTQLPPISSVVAEASGANQRQGAVKEYAQVHGQELSNLGINLNFAPVIDLNQGVINPEDKYSQIYRRAISDDPLMVTQVATDYCQTLLQSGVMCTLKHFPGLGRVETDTHVASAQLETPISELEMTDWIPFQTLMGNVPAITMLGHAKLMDLDGQNPVSFSNKAIAYLLRHQWGYDGVLITDDFCMKAVYGSPGSVQGAVVKALNAGVDLILIAYDSDLYYPVMDALLQADRKGHLNTAQLNQSQGRLQRQAKLMTSRKR